ncbi:MAG: glycosyltransferase [Acidobacteria bacterium]|nr:glycosyltransferase [Acidobacteriota bacterium]MCA1637877.1 glycosyltransferase [Acidobacteriota bacterium]
MVNNLLKSVHLTNYYHKNSGGISTSYNNLLDAAARHRRFVSLIVPGEREETEQINEFAKIYYVPAKQSPVFDKRYRIMMPWQYLLKNSIIRKILLAEMPQMIEVTDKYTLSLIGAMIRIGKFRQLGRPMLVHFSCERMDDNIGSFLARGKIAEWFARRVMGNYNFPSFDFHIANSPYTAEEFYKSVNKSENPRRSDWFFNFCWRFFNAARVPIEERVAVCPRGVNSETFSPARKSDEIKREMRVRAGIPENAIVLLYAGRISPEKNIGLLPDFMEILAKDEKRDFRLLVAGAGPQADWLTEQTEKRIPNKIIQLGHLDKETLANYYANCDIFVHPNPREPFGIAPLEAMASGVPTLAPNAGGLLSYATNENMWLTTPTAENFAGAVCEIIENPVARESKIKNALQTAQVNTWEKSTDRLLATYDQMYEYFQKWREGFTDTKKSKEFDFVKLTEG